MFEPHEPLVVPAPDAAVCAQLAEYGLADAAKLTLLHRYLTTLLATNRAFNLTAVTDPDAAWSRHIADSLSLLPWLRLAPEGAVADVGSGGGLPALPLAIALPERSFTLVETTGKKASFLAETARALTLLGGEHIDAIRTPTGTIVRTRKVQPTPKRYPRKPGEPKRAPLL